jgi:hypothetical protein
MTEDAVFELLSLECRVDVYGTLRYYSALGQIHREYGPAIICTDGTYLWYQNGQRHRVDGPAVEYDSGYRAWWQNGQRHRVDGPAVIYSDGSRVWFINGKELTETEWQQAVTSMEAV